MPRTTPGALTSAGNKVRALLKDPTVEGEMHTEKGRTTSHPGHGASIGSDSQQVPHQPSGRITECVRESVCTRFHVNERWKAGSKPEMWKHQINFLT